jgi:hypothetical protein
MTLRRVFALTFAVHLTALVLAFFYAMSWSMMTLQNLTIELRTSVADFIYAILAFPLPLLLERFPQIRHALPGLAGYVAFAMVSVLWATVFVSLLSAWRHFVGSRHTSQNAG